MPIANRSRSGRTYRSPLRKQQAAATHDRILDALIAAMADGLAEVSMPAVARRAGVSVATVYRHFPNKQALFDAMPGYFARRTGSGTVSDDGNDGFRVPASADELERMLVSAFEATERMDPVMRAAIDSPLGDEARRAQMPQRLRFIETTVETVAPGLEEPVRARLARLLVVLTSSGAQRTMSAAGLGPRQAADDVMWIIRALSGKELVQT